MIGQAIGHYEITAKLGQGGMGEVYRARDTKLDRDVALKFLPLGMVQHETARLRFIREAKAAAAIDHPYICSIYEVGQTQAGADYIAMEYVAGQTLQEKLEEGPIPLGKALPLLIEAAEALEKAHNAGIVHRDLKPANLMLTAEGHVKVMDFGLAKRVLSSGAEQATASGLTQEGSALGTLTYMSPEQLRGEELDTRSDLFSFGVVLYETLTGVHPFRRKQSLETASAILNEAAPPIGRYMTEVPYLLERIAGKLLSKEPGRRYQLIHEVKTDLDDLRREWESGGARLSSYAVSRGAGNVSWRGGLPWGLAGLFCLISAVTLWHLWFTPAPSESSRRLRVDLGAEVSPASGSGVVLSPDESLLAFFASSDTGDRELYLRNMGQLQATLLPGARHGQDLAFSPDGQWIAFRASRTLKKIAVNGGSPLTLCPIGSSRGIDWSEDGSIVFSPDHQAGLWRVSGEGGTAEPLTTLAEGEAAHRWPQVLPGGKAVLFSVSPTLGQFDDAQIAVQRLTSEEKKILWQGGYHARYLPSGHLVYLNQGRLYAVAFDLENLEIRGQPAPILEDVEGDPSTGSAQFTFSKRGALVYLPLNRGARRSELEWLDRQGVRESLPLPPGEYGRFQFSPSGRLLAFDVFDGKQQDIWTYDIERDQMARLTHDPADDYAPVWSPSGERIIFASERKGVANLYWKRSDGGGEVQRLTESQNPQTPTSWHPRGQFVAFTELSAETSLDLRLLVLEGENSSGWSATDTTTCLSTSFSEATGRFSSDGRWLAYSSNRSGTWQVYVRPFPGGGGEVQISKVAGAWPVWAAPTNNLFYSPGGGQLFIAGYGIDGDSFVADRPVEWEEGQFFQLDDLWSLESHPDGQRLLVRRRANEGSKPDRNHVVLFENFFDYLKQQAPLP